MFGVTRGDEIVVSAIIPLPLLLGVSLEGVVRGGVGASQRSSLGGRVARRPRVAGRVRWTLGGLVASSRFGFGRVVLVAGLTCRVVSLLLKG